MIPSEKKANSLEERGLLILGKIFKVAKDTKSLSPLEKYKIRIAKSQEIINQFYDYIEVNDNRVLPQSLLEKSFTYAKKWV